MLLPVFVATFAGLALALFVLWAAAAERKPLSPRERFIRERTQQSGMLAWRRGARLLRTARRAGGRPWRLAPGLEAWLTILQCGSGPAKPSALRGAQALGLAQAGAVPGACRRARGLTTGRDPHLDLATGPCPCGRHLDHPDRRCAHRRAALVRACRRLGPPGRQHHGPNVR